MSYDSIKEKLNALLSLDKKAEDGLRGRGHIVEPDAIQRYKQVVEKELTEHVLASAKESFLLNPCPQSIVDFAHVFLMKILRDHLTLDGDAKTSGRRIVVSSEWESVLLETSALELILLVAFVRLSRDKVSMSQPPVSEQAAYSDQYACSCSQSVAAANFDTLWNEYDSLRAHKVKMVDRFDRRAVYRALESLERSKLIGAEDAGLKHKKSSIYNQVPPTSL